MINQLMETGVQVAATLLITLIGVLGSYLTLKLSRKHELASINAAQQEAVTLAQQTVEELQQTVVASLKDAHADGRLSEEEIELLKETLVKMTLEKLSRPAYDLLRAAAVDVAALITGAGEKMVLNMKNRGA